MTIIQIGRALTTTSSALCNNCHNYVECRPTCRYLQLCQMPLTSSTLFCCKPISTSLPKLFCHFMGTTCNVCNLCIQKSARMTITAKSHAGASKLSVASTIYKTERKAKVATVCGGMNRKPCAYQLASATAATSRIAHHCVQWHAD